MVWLVRWQWAQGREQGNFHSATRRAGLSNLSEQRAAFLYRYADGAVTTAQGGEGGDSPHLREVLQIEFHEGTF